MTDREYEVGESITVPWGLDTVEGTVVGAYGEGSGRRVLVEVNVGDGATETLPFPQRALDAARSPELQSPPGAWVKAARFEESVRAALMEALHESLPTWEGEARSNIQLLLHQEIDFMASLPDRALLVEVKYHSSGGYTGYSSTMERLAAILMAFRRESTPAVGLLVMNTEPPKGLSKQAFELRRRDIPIWAVGWDTDRPYTDRILRQAVGEAVNYRFPLTSSGKEPG
ncbi:hypothetical protein AB0I66_25370 [Streptomyces sp. NPDC050439]|uniref:hypothetical protein n=1 Tax=unclassified Streptomyces TaxID=2593676 RepID=UPI003417FE15